VQCIFILVLTILQKRIHVGVDELLVDRVGKHEFVHSVQMALRPNSLEQSQCLIVHMVHIAPGVFLGVWKDRTRFHFLFNVSLQLERFVVNAKDKSLVSVERFRIHEFEVLIDKLE